jgi:hypothetical protein
VTNDVEQAYIIYHLPKGPFKPVGLESFEFILFFFKVLGCVGGKKKKNLGAGREWDGKEEEKERKKRKRDVLVGLRGKIKDVGLDNFRLAV